MQLAIVIIFSSRFPSYSRREEQLNSGNVPDNVEADLGPIPSAPQLNHLHILDIVGREYRHHHYR